MEETDSKITVSSINDINSFNMERIITIRGDPEKICKAEAEISTKLRQAFESDLNSLPVSFNMEFAQWTKKPVKSISKRQIFYCINCDKMKIRNKLLHIFTIVVNF